MAKLKGPLLSQKASGSVSDGLTYSERKSGSQVRFQRKQKDVLTAARTLQRSYYTLSYGWWNELTPAEKSEWNY